MPIIFNYKGGNNIKYQYKKGSIFVLIQVFGGNDKKKIGKYPAENT
jgi:hypothetical protein